MAATKVNLTKLARTSNANAVRGCSCEIFLHEIYHNIMKVSLHENFQVYGILYVLYNKNVLATWKFMLPYRINLWKFHVEKTFMQPQMGATCPKILWTKLLQEAIYNISIHGKFSPSSFQLYAIILATITIIPTSGKGSWATAVG